ncbi:MAG: RagB/SusD family nutrient uptake outer membrane protein, partial [Bacteroidales bacterium]|nr:RagB/SusD family nutrient uptake outer membrane protein [Bacteroidales bacterium]
MKTNIRLLLISLGAFALTLSSCTDLDTFPESGVFTSDQKQEIAEAIPERLSADVLGMYSLMGRAEAVFPGQERADDFGYPAVCVSWDANGSDFVTDESNYNWFSVASSYEDRIYTYANPAMRWRFFYKQMKMANDILAAIPADTDVKTLKFYMGQALAIRAFDYLSLAPYFQFKFKGNEQEPSVPIVTWDMTGDVSVNPRAPQEDVYDLIIDDLTRAIELLDGFSRSSKGQINQQVAYGLRARANLMMENWEAAAFDADKALEGFTPYSREDVSKPTFINAADPSWMWAIMIDPANVSGLIAWPSTVSSFSGYGYTTAVGCYKGVNRQLWDIIPETD